MNIFYRKSEDDNNLSVIETDEGNLCITYSKVEDIKLSPAEIIVKIINTNPFMSFYGYDEEGLNGLLYCILKGDKDLIPNFIGEKNNTFGRMNYYFIEKHIGVYQKLMSVNDESEVIVETNKENFLETLDVISKLRGNYSLFARDITLLDFYHLLKDVDMNKYGEVIIDYQEYSTPVKLKTIYDIANMTSELIELALINNLSPLEQIILVYDRIKRREYKESEDNLFFSRDIDKVLTGDSIVCLGYANLFSVILSSLNIDNRVVINVQGNHARNAVHILDDKYNIDKVLYFDVTGDSKKKGEDNYIGKYNYFGMTLENANYLMEEEFFKYYSEDIDPLKYLETEDFFELAMKGSHRDYFINLSPEMQDEAKRILEEVKEKYRRELGVKSFATALYTVREVEYDSFMIDEVNLRDIKSSVLTRCTNMVYLYGKRLGLSKEDIDGLKLDLCIEMCLSIIPYLDEIDQEKKSNSVKKLTLKNKD